MFNNLPKVVTQTIFLIKALNPLRGMALIQRVIYLWREFYIKVRLIPIVESIKVEFKYKEEMLTSCKIKNIEDLIKIIDRIALNNSEKGKDID